MNELLRGAVVNPDRVRGKSAYEIAVMHGFEGTEEEWLAHLEVAQSESLKDASEKAQAEIESDRQTALSDIADAKATMLNEIELAAEIVQTTGDSETAVMSQNSTTKEFDKIATNQNKPMLWENGTIVTDGTEHTSETVLRTKDCFSSDDFTFAKIEKDGVFFAVSKYDSEKNFIERTAMNLTKYRFESGYFYKIAFVEKVGGSDIYQTVEDFYKVGLYSYHDSRLESKVEAIEGGMYSDGNAVDLWENGSISLNGDVYDSTTIIRTKDFFTCDDFMSAHMTKENCFMAVARYNAEKAFIDRTPFDRTEYVFEEGYLYKIYIREVSDAADIEQTVADFYKVALIVTKTDILERRIVGNINNSNLWENGTIVTDGTEYASDTILRTKGFFTCRDIESAKIVKAGATFAVARYTTEKSFVDRSSFNLTEYVFENGYLYKLVLLEKVDGVDLEQTVQDFYKIEMYGDKVKHLMEAEKESKEQIKNLSEKVSAISKGAKRLWGGEHKKGTYEAWAFGNTWFDKSTGKHCLIYNAKSSHVSTDGNVYFTSKFDFDDFDPENQILVAEHTSTYGCRCHGSGIAANGDYIALVLHHNATGGGPLYVYRSTDKGATWTSAECLIDGVNLTSGESGSCFLTKSGRLLSFDRINGTNGDYCKIIRSDNNGVSWSGTDINKGTAASPLEGSFVQLSNGNIYCIVRGVLFDNYNVMQKTYITKSTDNGVTWTTLAEMADFDATCNPVSVIYHEKSKRVEMVYGSRFVLPNGKNAIYRRICTETEFENGYYGEAVKIAESGTGADFGYVGVSKSDKNVINAYYYCDDKDGGVCICNMVLDFIF